MDFTHPTSDVNENTNPLYRNSFQKNFVQGNQGHINHLPSHPLVQLKHKDMLKSELQKLKEVSVQFGSSMAVYLQVQRSIAGSNSRESTIPISNHGLHQTMGLYDKVSFCDYLGKRKPFDVDESLFYKTDN